MLICACNYPQTFRVCSDINLLALNEALLCLMRREPRGFAFVQFVDPYEASEAQHHINGKRFAGREISVVLAAESRKRPEEMRHRARGRYPFCLLIPDPSTLYSLSSLMVSYQSGKFCLLRICFDLFCSRGPSHGGQRSSYYGMLSLL